MAERKPRKPKAPDPVAAFIEAMKRYGGIRVSSEGPYKALDRFRDFSTVFGSEAGRRVLAQINDYADKRVSEKDAANHSLLTWRAGQAEMARWITATAHVPPREQQ